MKVGLAGLAKVLKDARQASGLSQRALASKAGTSQMHVWQAESAKTDVRVSTLIDFSRLLDLELMLVPKALVPAVEAMIEAHRIQTHGQKERADKSLYALEDEET